MAALGQREKASPRAYVLRCAPGSCQNRAAAALTKRATSCSPSRASRKANGNRSAPRTRLNAYTKNSNAGSRRKPSCYRQKPPRCSSGRCWPLDRSRCEKLTVGRASPKSHSIRRLTSPHDRVTSSCWRSCQTQFQHKLRRHLLFLGRALAFPDQLFEPLPFVCAPFYNLALLAHLRLGRFESRQKRIIHSLQIN
jgi:hypothetical protein